jgi:CBS domain-containing protein
MPSVRDIMRTDVVTIRVDDSARSLARVLADSEISGVPVLDGNGRVVGVASATDLVRLAAGEAEVTLSSVTMRRDIDRAADLDEEDLDEALEADPYGFFLPEDSPLRGTDLLEQLPETTFDQMTVEDVMTPVAFSIGPDSSIPELCEYLVRGRIHRALVVEDGELLGIVTSQDVLRAIADVRIAV